MVCPEPKGKFKAQPRNYKNVADKRGTGTVKSNSYRIKQKITLLHPKQIKVKRKHETSIYN